MEEHPGRWSRSVVAHDLLVAAGTLLVTVALIWNGELASSRPAPDRPGPVALALGAAAALLLLGRRRRPVPTLVATTVALCGVALTHGPVGLPLPSAVALYSVAAASAPPRRRSTLAPVVAVCLAGSLAAAWVALGAPPWSEALHTVLLWVASWLGGERSRFQRERIEKLTRDAARDHALAVADERARIARDLHDSVGHAINVIAVRAGAARLRHQRDPERTLDALTTIEELARVTVAEIDQLVGALRTSVERDGPAPPSLRSLPDLLRDHEGAGAEVAVEVSGGERPLPANIDRAAYRIVQEGLTNASRHGRNPVRLGLTYDADRLTVTIRNRLTAPPATLRRGHGLTGASERADLVGGSLTTSVDGDRFVLTAVLPLPAAP